MRTDVLVQPARRPALRFPTPRRCLTGLLQAPIRIVLITVAGIHQADRRCNDEFAAVSLAVAYGERSLEQEIKLVLVQAAFQSQKQPVIVVPRNVIRLLVDQYRVDDATYLSVAASPGRCESGARPTARRPRRRCRGRPPPPSGQSPPTSQQPNGQDHRHLGPARQRRSLANGGLQHAARAIVASPDGRTDRRT